MRVEIWSDYICAFCYLGRKQFEEALRQFPHRDKVEILLRSFELRPEIHPQLGISIYEYASQVSGIAPSRARQMYAQVSEQAEKIGIDYQPDKIVPANTFHAHCLTHYAAGHGKSLELSELIYQAYFSEGINIDDPDVLTSLAERIGLNRMEVEEVLKSDQYAEKVWEDEKTSRLMGIQGVPFFLFDRNHGMSGAQDVSIFKKALETAWNNTIAVPKERHSDPSELGCSGVFHAGFSEDHHERRHLVKRSAAIRVMANTPIHLSLFAGWGLVTPHGGQCFRWAVWVHILLENGNSAAVTRSLQSFQQNHAVEDALVHELAKLRFVCIQLGKTVCFRR